MAEQEVIKHTKKVYKIWNSNSHSTWHKIKEFLIEIIIIVFAVSFSIWLHDRSEHNHQQKEVKEFLVGLREDLMNDIREMKGDMDSYTNQAKAFKYISSIKLNDSLHSDSLKKYQAWIFNTTGLQQNSGRFEGFKSSGKIGTIEDKKLQNDIMDLYQEAIPSLLASTDAYVHRKNQLFDFGIRNRKRLTDSTTNLSAMLVTEEAWNYASLLANTGEILQRYNNCIEKMQKIVKAIELKYNWLWDVNSGVVVSLDWHHWNNFQNAINIEMIVKAIKISMGFLILRG